MSPHICVHWIGFRKDSNKGAVWGWFTETNKPTEPLRYIPRPPDEVSHPVCHMFYGRIGKELHIIPSELTSEFLAMIDNVKKNYKTADAAKIASRWGKRFDEDLSMYLLMLKIKG